MEYKEWILQMLKEIKDDDIYFLSFIYTLMKRHLEKKEG